MKVVLSRTHPEKYWDVFNNLLWYKNSLINEDTDPRGTSKKLWQPTISSTSAPTASRIAATQAIPWSTAERISATAY
jgi:hypothetical protein